MATKPGVKVFYVEPTDQVGLWLRRYRGETWHHCPKTGSYCNAQVRYARVKVDLDEDGYLREPHDRPADDDPRWPQKCDHCGEPFSPEDPHQIFQERIYRAADGREWAKRDLPPGACYDATWAHDTWVGPDGRSLVVILPDGTEWHIDGPANNCTLKDDREHKCWVRHGRPEDGTLHVDKKGKTCSAGAGSISTRGYHGFLHHGYLVPC